MNNQVIIVNNYIYGQIKRRWEIYIISEETIDSHHKKLVVDISCKPFLYFLNSYVPIQKQFKRNGFQPAL